MLAKVSAAAHLGLSAASRSESLATSVSDPC